MPSRADSTKLDSFCVNTWSSNHTRTSKPWLLSTERQASSTWAQLVKGHTPDFKSYRGTGSTMFLPRRQGQLLSVAT